MKKVIVLGAGLQGVCVALALQDKGCRVQLIDQASGVLTRASLRNEGKIHLGFVYAKDNTKQTMPLMLAAALSFGPLIEKFTARKLTWPELTSNKFTYLIARDSLVPAKDLFEHYEQVQEHYSQILRDDPSAHYLGQRPDRLWDIQEYEVISRYIRGDSVSGAASTMERALDLVPFNKFMESILEGQENIQTQLGCTVQEIQRTSSGFRVTGINLSNSSWTLEAEQVVNCLWEGRIKFDRQLGYGPERNWVYRLKYRLLGTLPEKLRSMPSCTLVLGRYGDVVVYPQQAAYFSWYLACMRGWEQGYDLPQHWEQACNNIVPENTRAEIKHAALSGLATFIPGIEQSSISTVDAGVICAWGDSDIDKLDSELHQRFEIGIHSYDGYYSIDTGKLTTAPYFAEALVRDYF